MIKIFAVQYWKNETSIGCINFIKYKFLTIIFVCAVAFLIGFQNCSKVSFLGAPTPFASQAASSPVGLTKVLTTNLCTFFLLDSGSILFAGNGKAGCDSSINTNSPPDVNVLRPSRSAWLPQNIVDIKTATYSYPLFLANDGTVSSIPYSVIASGIKSISLGSFGRRAFLRNDGTVFTSNSNEHPLLNGATQILTPYGCEYMTCAIVSENLQCSNADSFNCSPGVYSPPTDLTGISSISGIYNLNVYAIKNGGVMKFGSPSTPVANLAAGVTEVATTLKSACAIKNGTVWCWGKNDFGQLGDGTKVDSPDPVQVPGLSEILQVSISESHACARSSSSVWCWGSNQNGQLGTGDLNDSVAPMEVKF